MNPTLNRAPSVMLPLRFVFMGIGSLVVAVALLVMRPELLATYHYNQWIIAVTHLVTLGWLMSIVMGAMYQLVPVALETSLFSERLARWQFLFHAIGVVGLVTMFWRWDIEQVEYFGSVFGLGVLLFVYNMGRTLVRVPRWNVVAAAVGSALFWLVVTMLFGLFVATSKSRGLNWFAPLAQMHAHAHAGVAGFFLMMTVGVSYKLAPMFLLSEMQSHRRAAASVALLNLGLAGTVPSILMQSSLKFVFGSVICCGLVVYGIELTAIVRARKRRAMDWAMTYFLSAVTLLVPVSVLGLGLGWPRLALTELTGQLENVYGFLSLLGIVSFAIIGMLYKILPFLAWYASYSKEIGRCKVPSLADLYSVRLQGWGYASFLSGVIVTAVGAAYAQAWAVRCGCALLAGSLSLFLINVGMILSHLMKPRLQPLPVLNPKTATARA
jgi:hypothetical protein